MGYQSLAGFRKDHADLPRSNLRGCSFGLGHLVLKLK